MALLSDGIKKFFLAGVGAAAVTGEKAQEIIEDLIAKGELTVEQGKAYNEELKHNIKEKVVGKPDERAEKIINSLTPEELEALKAKISEAEKKADEPIDV